MIEIQFYWAAVDCWLPDVEPVVFWYCGELAQTMHAHKRAQINRQVTDESAITFPNEFKILPSLYASH